MESVQVQEPLEDVSKVWVFVLLFRSSWGGLSISQLLRSPALLQTVAKTGGVYPALGLRP